MELPIPSHPHPSVLSRLLDPVGRCLTPEVAQHLVALQVDPAVQARLDELAEKCTEGQLSAESVPSMKPTCRPWSLLRCSRRRPGAS
jgi:hypothetical protein